MVEILNQCEKKILAEEEYGDILEVIKHFVTREIKWDKTFSKANEIKL